MKHAVVFACMVLAGCKPSNPDVAQEANEMAAAPVAPQSVPQSAAPAAQVAVSPAGTGNQPVIQINENGEPSIVPGAQLTATVACKNYPDLRFYSVMFETMGAYSQPGISCAPSENSEALLNRVRKEKPGFIPDLCRSFPWSDSNLC